MEETLLENLRRNQAFDAALRKGEPIDKIVAASILAILIETNDQSRAQLVQTLEGELVAAFKNAYQPAAKAIASQNAARVIKLLPGPQATAAELRSARQAAVSAATRDSTRVDIVRAAVNDDANTLENSLRRYYLEPGPPIAQKRQELIQQHAQQEQKRLEYDKASEQFNKGVTEVRPRKPQLDFGSRFTEEVKKDIREQARRTGTDAETAAFAKAGYEVLSWVTVNGPLKACPDCSLRQGASGDLAFWDRMGRPGSGRTVCGSACFCMLVPADTVKNHPGLKNGLNQPKRGVLTSQAEADIFNHAR